MMRDLLRSLAVDRWVVPALFLWPLLAAPLVRFLGRDSSREESGTEAPAGGPDARTLTLMAFLIEAVLGVMLWLVFDPTASGWQARVDWRWLPDVGATFSVGVDGLSLPMVVLSALLMPLALLGAWDNVKVNTPSYGALLLALTSGIIGVFVSLDLLLFYMSWELMLIPMYFVIGVWGGTQRTTGALKYVLVTMVGSLLMLLAIIALWAAGGQQSFHLDRLLTVHLTLNAQLWMFGAFFLAFAVKSALVPFHSWLPDAQHAAPTFGAVTLGLKVGMYAILRFAIPLFPAAAVLPWVQSTILVLSVVCILYGALLAMVQTDIKRLISYSSISHLGFIMLGCFVFTQQSVEGAVMIMINHGVSTSALFLLVGMLEDRRGTHRMSAFGGLARIVPLFAVMLTLTMLSTIGLPGTNGFVGEFLVLLGTYREQPVLAVIATTAVVLAAIYGLRALQGVLFEKLAQPANTTLPDLSRRELAVMSVFAVAILWLGLAPQPVLQRIEGASTQIVQQVRFGQNATTLRAAAATDR